MVNTFISPKMIETMESIVGHTKDIGQLMSDFCSVPVVKNSVGRNMGHDGVSLLVILAECHDIGKLVLPRKILFKNGHLDSTEGRIVKMHAFAGMQMAKKISSISSLAEYILYHHERYDGSGYFGLRGKDIPLACRLMGIVDMYDAMICDRPYRKAMSSEVATEELLRSSGSQLDSYFVQLFVSEVLGYKH